MLRTHLLQLWNSRSDQGTQDDLLDIIPFRAFSKIDELAQGQAPDATTTLRFRHFLEQHDLARKLFEKVVEQMGAKGLLTRQGSIVDSTNIQAPCSTKNKERKRDPEMHQSRKGSDAEPLPKGAGIRFDKSRVALSAMGSKQRGRKGGQGFGNIKPVKPLRQSQGKEQAPQEMTARRRFLSKMEQIVPWARLLALLQPFYPQVGPQGGRPPYPLEVMLRTHFLQLWNSRSDQGTQDDLLDIIPFRAFSKIDALAQGQAPDATTILRFRHFLEQYDLARKIFDAVVEELEAAGLLTRQGSIVDSTHIQAPCSTKNKERKRDPEMHQSRKGNQWFFGMKCHVGVDKDSGLIHAMAVTAGNVSDVTVAAELLHGQEEVLYGDAGYQGLENREEMAGKQVECRIAMRPGKRRQLPDTPEGRLQELCEKAKAHIRAKVEHVFRVLKQQLGFSKTRLRGLKKNRSKLWMLAASINLFSARRHLLAATG